MVINVKKNNIPQNINILNNDGSIKTISYKELKEHEEKIILDNICFGLTHQEYSKKEIEDYEKQAWEEWNNLKYILKENPTAVLKLDKKTERYVVALQIL